jgi:hypothetical protein
VQGSTELAARTLDAADVALRRFFNMRCSGFVAGADAGSVFHDTRHPLRAIDRRQGRTVLAPACVSARAARCGHGLRAFTRLTHINGKSA